MKVDAHHHFWRLSRGDYGWLTPDLAAIYRDHGPEHLRPLLAATGVDRTVLVQAAPTAAETAFLLDLAEATPFVAGVVGWLDFDAPDAAAQVERAARRPALKGLRPMLQDLPDVDWMLRATLHAPLRAMTDAGLVFDALVTPRHLPTLTRFLALHRDLTVVIDHGAKPAIARGERAAWEQAMRRIASESTAVCKLSGLVTEARPGWEVEDLAPYAEVLLECFGPARLMWGSDWPVLNLNGDYGAWHAAAQALVSHLSAPDQDLIFGGVAARIYGLDA